MSWIVIPLVAAIMVLTVVASRPRARMSRGRVVRDAALRSAVVPKRELPVPVLAPRPRASVATPARVGADPNPAAAPADPPAMPEQPASEPAQAEDPWAYQPPEPTAPLRRQAKPEEMAVAPQARDVRTPESWWRVRPQVVEDAPADIVPDPAFPSGGTYHPEGWDWTRQRDED